MKRWAVLLVVGACAPNVPVAAPAPEQITTSKPMPDVISTASRVLADAGFEISASDGAAGVITAKRTKPQRENAAYIACEHNIGGEGKTSGATGSFTSTVTVSVNARRDGPATIVRTSGLVDGHWQLMGNAPVKCASSGAIERAIVDAVR